MPSTSRIVGDNWLFQQDNTSIHVSRSTKNWLEERNIQCLSWPALSPDLNPIENIWDYLVRKVYQNDKQYSTTNELKVAIEKEWQRIHLNIMQKHILSMKDRVYKLIEKKKVLIQAIKIYLITIICIFYFELLIFWTNVLFLFNNWHLIIANY